MNARRKPAIWVLSTGICLGLLSAQQAPTTYWVEKTKGGIYVPPNKPLTRLSDLKASHPGQTTWKELVVKDPEIQAEYNLAAPGTKISRRLHPDTGNFMVIVEGEMHFDIEGQKPIVAKRGSIVNILRATLFSYEIAGDKPALWVDVNPINFKTVFPADGPPPQPMAGGEVIKVSFARTPAGYVAPNMPHWNLFEAASAGSPAGVRVLQDHLFASPLYGFADAGGRGTAAPPAPFNPNSVFGHMHAGPAEWWIVQVGQISAKFENTGEFVASEGDILYAPPMMWHQMAFKGPGPSCRLAMGAYSLINMNNTAGR